MNRSDASSLRAGLEDLCCRWPLSAGVALTADVYLELLRQYVVLWVQKTYPDGKYVFQWIHADSHRQDHPAVLSGIQNSGGLAAIFAVLEHAGLLYPAYFAGESPGDASCQ